MFECEALSKFVMKTGFQQLVNQPTRVTKKSSSVIDHIYSNRDDRICEISIPSVTLSDHFPLCVTRKFNSRHTKTNSHSVLKYRSFKNFQLIKFQRDLSLSPLNLLETEEDPDKALYSFYEILNDVLSRHAPIKHKRIKSYHLPNWFSAEIKKAMYERDRFHK